MPEIPCLKILVLIAAPVWDGAPGREPVRLDTGREWRLIADGFRDDHPGICIDRLPLATGNCLRDALADAQGAGASYQVVHISCHGTEGRLAFDDGFGCVDSIDARSLGRIFHDKGVQVVTLSACSSAAAGSCDPAVADALVEAGVPAVIGMTRPVDDRVATMMTAVLYRRLSAGQPVGRALDEAREAVRSDPAFQGTGGRRSPAEDADVMVIRGDPGLVPRLVPADPGVSDRYPPGNAPHNAFFCGRAEDLVLLARELDRSCIRGAAISGPGGIGKSSLATEFAWRFSARYKAIIYAKAGKNLPLNDTRVLDEAARVLALMPGADVIGELNRRPCLLFLDDLHLVSDENMGRLGDLIRRLDPACSKVIATFRGPWAGLAGIPGMTEVPLGDLDGKNAFLLLQSELSPRRNSWYTGEDQHDAAALDRLVRACRFHPYLLQLAAARLADQPFDQVCRELESMRGEFHEWISGFLEGQLRAADRDSACLLPQLSIFPAAFHREAVAAICAGNIPHDKELVNLRRLRLLQYDEESERYSLLDLTRDYARTLLAEGESESLGGSHAGYFLGRARSVAEILDTDRKEAIRQAVQERTDWIAGMQYFVDHEEWGNACRFGYAAETPLQWAGLWNDRKPSLWKGLQAADHPGGSWFQYFFTMRLGQLSMDTGEMDNAQMHLEKSLEMVKRRRKEGAWSLVYLGALACDQEDYPRARKYLYASLAGFARRDDRQHGESEAFRHMGRVAIATGDFETAQDYLAKALERDQAEGSTIKIPKVHYQMGILAREKKDFPEAWRQFRTCLPMFREGADRRGESWTLHQCGLLALAEGKDPSVAKSCFEKSMAISSDHGDRPTQARNFFQLGVVAREQKDPDTARTNFGTSRVIFQGLRAERSAARASLQLAMLEKEAGNISAASAYGVEADEILARLGDHDSEEAHRVRVEIEGKAG